MMDRDDLRWQAIVNCDVRAAGTFVYGRSAGGLYPPLCRSRSAGQAGIVSFDTPTAAQAQSYRACGECHPDQVGWLVEASCWM